MSLRSFFSRWRRPKRLDVAARFELDRQAISGTMSTFYRARDRATGQIVGLKLCDAEQTAAFERRFAGMHKPSEGEISLALVHPRIVRTLEAGETTDGRPYLVQEFLDGVGLHALIAQGHAAIDGKRLAILRWAAEAVAAVHDAGYVHRDICPRNFIVAHDASWLKLIDFGLTLPAREPFLSVANRSGVPRYLAPEVLRMRPFDTRADIFSFGVVAYEVCTGEHPWPGDDASGQAAVAHDATPPINIRTHGATLDERLATMIMKSLSADPNQRPQTMAEFLRAC